MTLDIQQNVSLQPYNTMAVPAKAQYLIEVDTIQKAQQAISFADQNKLQMLVLGEGSNTLFTKDYKGLVLLNRLLGLELLEEDDHSVLLKVSAGENWHHLVAYAIEQGWYGLENLALIPGLVGAAPIQNIGAYGVEVKDCIIAVDFLDFENLELTSMANAECEFAYRDSVFKNAKHGKGAITSVTFRLSKQPKLTITYPALATYFSDHISPTAKNIFDAVIAIRSDKLPSPSDIPNLGSFFKNPIVDAQQHRALKKEYPNLVSYPYGSAFKLAAAWLIDTAGWKSRKLDQISVHAEQALVIINPHRVSGANVINFANQLRSNIHKQFGIRLDIEPKII